MEGLRHVTGRLTDVALVIYDFLLICSILLKRRSRLEFQSQHLFQEWSESGYPTLRSLIENLFELQHGWHEASLAAVKVRQ